MKFPPSENTEESERAGFFCTRSAQRVLVDKEDCNSFLFFAKDAPRGKTHILEIQQKRQQNK